MSSICYNYNIILHYVIFVIARIVSLSHTNYSLHQYNNYTAANYTYDVTNILNEVLVVFN